MSLAAIVVWSVLLASFVVHCGFVAIFASPFLRWDDLDWVDGLGSPLRLNLEWLWSAHVEHRIPFPRVIGVWIASLFGDIRAVMFFDVFLLCALAAGMIATARRLRGRTEFGDAAFAMLLLTPGAAEHFVWMHGISFLLPITILGSILLWIATVRGVPGPARSVAIGLAAFSLPLCGGPGLTTVPAILAWSCWVGWRTRRSAVPRERLAGKILVASAAATVALIAFYFVDFARPEGATWNPSMLNVLLQAWRYLALGLGIGASGHWPWSGVAAVVFALLVGTLLVRAWIRAPEERIRTAGIALWILAIVSMALVTGLVRGTPSNEAGFASRYVPLPALWWCGGLLALALHAPLGLARFERAAGLGVVAILLAFLPFHWGFMREHGIRCRGVTDAFSLDVAQGLDVETLADRHWARFHNHRRLFLARLREMQAYGLWPALERYARRRTERGQSRMISPLRIESSGNTTWRWLEGRFVLLVPAECALSYTIQPRFQRFEGEFGIHPFFYESRKTEGLRFTIELSPANGASEVLFEKTLRPIENPADRGFTEFSVSLPAAERGMQVVLRTSSVSADPTDPTQGFWNGVRMR